MNIEIVRSSSPAEASKAAADLIAQTSHESIKAHGLFTLALAGGNTPRTLYHLLASPPLAEKFDWSRTHFFWGDERCVSPDNPASNFAMSQNILLAKIQIPLGNIHRMPVETFSPAEAARKYETTLRSFADRPKETPRLDLILLGIGNDGHTASLFPANSSLAEKDRLVVATEDPNASPPVARITMTLPILNQAKTIIFLVFGPKKGEIMQHILDKPDLAAQQYPAALVRPKDRLIWFFSETLEQ